MYKIKKYDRVAIGVVNYNTGTITINNFGSNREIEMIVEPTEIDIITNKNVILANKQVNVTFADG
jgi:hypothetical protein